MARGWSRSELSDRLSATRHEVDAAINRTDAKQKQLIRLEQLAEIGLSPRGVQLRAAHGSLHRIHRGVYATHAPPYSPHQIWLAGTYACGPLSAISDWSAAAHLAMSESTPLVAEVTSPAGTGRGVAGITVHRRPLDRRDVWRKQDIPTTTAARTIIDLCGRAGLEGTEELIMAADSKRILDRGRLEQVAEERRGRPGVQHVLALITDDPVELRSVNEARMKSPRHATSSPTSCGRSCSSLSKPRRGDGTAGGWPASATPTATSCLRSPVGRSSTSPATRSSTGARRPVGASSL